MPYVLIFLLLLLCGLGLPMPEDITLFAAGVLSYYRVADVWIMIVVCYFGVMFGDSIVFLFGSFYGPAIRQKKFFQKLFPPKRLALVLEKIHQKGAKIMFAARFMPGLRAPIFFSAGTLHVPFRTFLFYDGLAAMVSVPAIIYVVYYFGEHVDHVIKLIKKVQFGILSVILLAAVVVITKMYFAHKNSVEEKENA